MVKPFQLIAFQRPLFEFSDEELGLKMEMLEDTIESQGGFANIDRLQQERFQLEIDHVINEMTYRN